jgi:hypothetical protein
VAAALRNVKKITDTQVIQRLYVNELYDGAVLADDVRSVTGALLCTGGQEVTPSMRARLRNYFANVGIQTQIKIFAPAAEASPGRILSPVSS